MKTERINLEKRCKEITIKLRSIKEQLKEISKALNVVIKNIK